MKRALLVLLLFALSGCAANGTAVDPSDFPLVSFRGNESLDADELLEAAIDHLRDYHERGVGKSAIDDAAYRIELHYRSLGYAFCVVDYVIEGRSLGLDDEPGEVAFLVDEGPRVVLTELQLDGGGAIAPERMRQIATAIAGVPGAAPFVRRALNDAASAVLVEARGRGYADAEAEVEVLALERESGVGQATIVLIPGRRYVIESIELRGGEEAQLARDVLDRYVGEPFEPRGAAAMLARVEEELRDAGYPDARAEIAERAVDAEGHARLVVAVTASELVHVSGLGFPGDPATRRSYLTDLIDIEPGDRYSGSEVRAALQRLYATGLFSRVQHRLEPPEGPQRELVFELTELPTLELWLEPGWGSYDGPRARAGLRELNLLGTGWVLRTEGLLSEKTRRAEVGVTDPIFLIPDLSLDVSTDYVRREEPSFEVEEAAFETSLRRRWNERISTTVGYRFKRSNLIADDLLSLDPAEVPSDFDVSAIKVSAINDTRDNLLAPHAGARVEVSGEWADALLGSELDFLRGAISVGLYHELRDTLVLATRVGAGAIVPIHDAVEIPLQERYFLGGENSVRSFEESELGPKDSNGESLGGQAYTLASVELRQRLPRSFEVALFADAGNLQDSYADVFSGEDYRYALGVGLRYELPVGSLRLDFGWNPNPLEDEDDYALHFSIGQAF
jgi:outer membrane protein assembly complex protein YaeT